jgi:hypothetical protein
MSVRDAAIRIAKLPAPLMTADLLSRMEKSLKIDCAQQGTMGASPPPDP